MHGQTKIKKKTIPEHKSFRTQRQDIKKNQLQAYVQTATCRTLPGTQTSQCKELGTITTIRKAHFNAIPETLQFAYTREKGTSFTSILTLKQG
jgi:hypothetical protein